MQPRLAVERVPQQAAAVIVKRDAGLVAGGLDAENNHVNLSGKVS